MADAMVAAAYRRAAAEEAQAAVRAVWARYADADDTVAASQVGAVLKDLDYNRRSLSLGRGLKVVTLEVAALPSDAVFALRELGVDEAAERSGARVSGAAFTRWYVAKTVGDAGARRNRLLVKPVTGRVKETSYTLPGTEYVYGAASRPDGATVAELLAHKFSPDGAHAAPPAPPRAAVDAVLAASVVKGGAHDAVYGAKSAKSEDIRELLRHAHAPAGGAEEAAYPAHLPVRAVGDMPPPRPTVTSTLRAAKTLRGVATRVEEATTGRPAGVSQWKMARFTAVPARVPTDGKPLHFPRA